MSTRPSNLFSSSDKEKEALAERENRSRGEDFSSEQLPSCEQDQIDRENVLQPPDLTAGFNNLRIAQSQDGLPTKEETIAHLKLLEAFYRLRQIVASTDGIFGINDDIVTGHSLPENDKTGELLARLAEKRWACYVQRAVDRFEAWWESLIPGDSLLDLNRLESEGQKGLCVLPENLRNPPVRIDVNNMPPLDVLMVWHAFMLNPRAYLEDCLRLGHMSLWHCPMPWSSVAACINSETFAFDPPAETASNFGNLTKLPWDSLTCIKPRVVRCPYCEEENTVPWTTCYKDAPTSGISDQAVLDLTVDYVLSTGKGFLDKDFSVNCHKCDALIDHDRLRAWKFVYDARKLIGASIPLPGTVLGLEGIPFLAFGKRDTTTQAMLKFPNNLLKYDLYEKIEKARKLHISDAPGQDGHGMDGIRSIIEAAMKDRKCMRRVRESASAFPRRTERIAIRKMMSRYWKNSSPFALDLLGAVIRQGSFIEKMHNIDWLHSPALPSTMSRLITKYTYFLKIMRDHLRRMAVPTLDVDLAWHTHQLNPAAYMEYTITQCRQFIDHDDKVAEVQLNDAFAWTSKTYQRMTGQAYSECTCWYCEATRESFTSAASRLFQTSFAQASERIHPTVQDPRKSVHISAHNAVRPTDDTKYDALSRAHAKYLERAFTKACERARKKGYPIPKRSDYYYSDAYGYPVYIPAYSPYIGFVPYAPMYYPATPGCLAVGAGASGACCSGTCGGGVASAGCAGAGREFAGGSVGGCGGGGGGSAGGSVGGCGGGGGGSAGGSVGGCGGDGC